MSDAVSSVDDPIDPKVIATLQARAALAGFELVQLADETFLIAKWGMHRSLEHPVAVETFLCRVEGKS